MPLNNKKPIGRANNKEINKLPYLQLVRISIPHLIWIGRKMGSAVEILLFLANHIHPNVNNIQVKQSTIAKLTHLSESQVTKAIKYLIEHQCIRKKISKDGAYFELNVAYLCKGGATSKVYYEPQTVWNEPNPTNPNNSFNTPEFIHFYNDFMNLQTETTTKELVS